MKSGLINIQPILNLIIRWGLKIFISVALVPYLKDFSLKDPFFKEGKLVEAIMNRSYKGKVFILKPAKNLLFFFSNQKLKKETLRTKILRMA